ncbi:hypothetical protein C1X29_17470 [Pseudomonas sp. GW456-12-10-14-LB2]|uniref:hypothetical protein n=1 Tax=Pseudomonas sp. GW456-12-10-14-LB2 TaxID=2070674 RepID=UPI000C9C30B9|nr:hypothetical protein [Pseudomonas sp. GW456-12-10-14-LB2]PNB48785.1 hypothetical protein C1X29_17470 [Pseudomonas sp. GW456-12-10-14-LB2]
MDTPIPALTRDDLPPLAIEESSKGFLVPAAARYNLTVTIDFPWLPGDFITIKVAGTPGPGSYTSPRIPIGGFKRPFTTHIDTTLVAFNLGLTVRAFYTLHRGTEPSVESQTLPLYIPLINQLDLPLPVIKEASDEGEGTHLDVSELAEVTLRIRSWLLSRREQFFWLRLTGVKPDGSVWEAWYWKAPENVVGNGFSLGYKEERVPAAPLQGLQNGSVLTMRFWAGLQNSPDLSEAQAFAHRNYTVNTVATNTPGISSVTDAEGEVPDGADTRYTSVTLSGSGFGAIDVFDGQTFLDTVNAVGGIWTYLAKALTGGLHSFTVRLADGSGGTSSPRRIKVVIQNLEVTIAEAPDNGNVDPLAVEMNLTAVVNYDMQPNDRIRVRWTAAPGTPAAGSHTTNTLTAGPTRPRRIPLPLTLVAFSLGKRVTVSAEYDRGTAQPVPLGPIHLNVGMIPADRFIPPVFLEANGTSDLFLASVQGGATLRFGVWPHIARLQSLWLDLEGEDINGAPHNLAMWTGNVTVNQSWVFNNGYSVIVLFSYLKDLRPGSTLTLRFRVNLDTVANSSTAQAFVLRQYTIR